MYTKDTWMHHVLYTECTSNYTYSTLVSKLKLHSSSATMSGMNKCLMCTCCHIPRFVSVLTHMFRTDFLQQIWCRCPNHFHDSLQLVNILVIKELRTVTVCEKSKYLVTEKHNKYTNRTGWAVSCNPQHGLLLIMLALYSPVKMTTENYPILIFMTCSNVIKDTVSSRKKDFTLQ